MAVRGDAVVALPRQVEHRLHFVGQMLYFGQFEESGQPFDRMETAEGRVQGFRMEWVALQDERLRFDRCQVVAAFEHEVAQQFPDPAPGWSLRMMLAREDVQPVRRPPAAR